MSKLNGFVTLFYKSFVKLVSLATLQLQIQTTKSRILPIVNSKMENIFMLVLFLKKTCKDITENFYIILPWTELWDRSAMLGGLSILLTGVKQ